MTFSVGQVATAAAMNAVTLTNVATYVPAVTGQGTATFTTQTGWYFKVGKVVFFVAYLVVNNAGNGASTVTVTTPSNIDRTTRQMIPVNGTGLSGGNLRSGWARCAVSGSGAVIDFLELVNSATDGISAITGSALDSGAIITIQGWYREA